MHRFKKPQLARLGHSCLQFKYSDLCKFKTKSNLHSSSWPVRIIQLDPISKKKEMGKRGRGNRNHSSFFVEWRLQLLSHCSEDMISVWSDNWWLRCLKNQYGFTDIILMCKLQEEFTKLAMYYKRPEVLSKPSELKRTQMLWIACPFPGCLHIPAVTGGKTTGR